MQWLTSVFYPKLLSVLKEGYTRDQFLKDLSAGTIVGIVALPLAIAFAIASGVSPEKGLITAIVAGFCISALGGSRVQIGGPTGAFVIIISGIIEKYGTDGLTVACVIAGIILIIMGFARFGSVIKFIPHPVIVGFTSGIAVIIFSSQIKDLLGLTITTVPADFLEKWSVYIQQISTINWNSAGVAFGSLAILIVWPKITHRIPGPLIALIAATAAVHLLELNVETIGSKFGSVPSTIPAPSLPAVDFAAIRNLFSPALTIALLAAIESLLSAVVADGMTGRKHRSNTELIAQGIANIASPLFGGIPATGAIARTATNIRNGGRTPFAGMIHAVVLLLIMLFFGQQATLIPLPCLAAILTVVAYNMSEWRSFRSILKSPRSDVIVLLLTFMLTVLLDLTIAIEVGMVLAVFLFMRRMTLVTNVGVITRELRDDDDVDEQITQAIQKELPAGVAIYEINGPLFFGASFKFEEAMNVVESSLIVRIIRMRHVPAIDATGLHAIQEVYQMMKRRGVHVVIAEIHAQPLIAFEKAGLDAIIGEENIQPTLESALQRTQQILSEGDLNNNANIV